MALFTTKKAPGVQWGGIWGTADVPSPWNPLGMAIPRCPGRRRRGTACTRHPRRTYSGTPPWQGEGVEECSGGSVTPLPDPPRNPSALGAHQCRRRAWRKAESPSITSRMATVSTAKAAKTGTSTTPPT